MYVIISAMHLRGLTLGPLFSPEGHPILIPPILSIFTPNHLSVIFTTLGIITDGKWPPGGNPDCRMRLMQQVVL